MGLAHCDLVHPMSFFPYLCLYLFLHCDVVHPEDIPGLHRRAGPRHFKIFLGHSVLPADSFAVTSASWRASFTLNFSLDPFLRFSLVLFLPESLHTLHLYWESSHLANTYLPLRTLPLRSGICGLADSPGCFLKMQNLNSPPVLLNQNLYFNKI